MTEVTTRFDLDTGALQEMLGKLTAEQGHALLEMLAAEEDAFSFTFTKSVVKNTLDGFSIGLDFSDEFKRRAGIPIDPLHI